MISLFSDVSLAFSQPPVYLNMRSYSAIRRAQEGKKLVGNQEDI